MIFVFFFIVFRWRASFGIFGNVSFISNNVEFWIELPESNVSDKNSAEYHRMSIWSDLNLTIVWLECEADNSLSRLSTEHLPGKNEVSEFGFMLGKNG